MIEHVEGPGAVRRAVLPSGLTVVVRENAAAPVVSLTLLVDVGSRDETRESNGVTALLGRTLLKGTRSRSALEIGRVAEDAGGAIDSATDQEYAEVSARGLARSWRTLLELVHDVVTAPRLDPEEIEREREGLLAHMRGLEDQPFQVASRLLNRALYGDGPHGLPTSGTQESVRRLGRAELVRHFETSYTPDRMTLALSGRVAASDLLAEATSLFRGAGAGGRARARWSTRDHPAALRIVATRPVQQAQLFVGFIAPHIGHDDHVALKVTNALLGAGMSSRLFRRLRDEAGLAYAVGSLYPTRRETSRVVVHIGTAPGNVVAAEAGIRDVLDGLRAGPVNGLELARSRTALAGSFALDLRTNARRSFHLAFFELMGVGADYLYRYPVRIAEVTVADVLRVAQRWLVQPAVVAVGPG